MVAYGRCNTFVPAVVQNDVAAVVHFDIPSTAKEYVHRSGRTGRAGNAGLVVSLTDRESKAAVTTLQRELGYHPTTHPPDLAALDDGRHDARPAEQRPAAQRSARRRRR